MFLLEVHTEHAKCWVESKALTTECAIVFWRQVRNFSIFLNCKFERNAITTWMVSIVNICNSKMDRAEKNPQCLSLCHIQAFYVGPFELRLEAHDIPNKRIWVDIEKHPLPTYVAELSQSLSPKHAATEGTSHIL